MSTSTTAPESLAGLKTLESQLADEAAAKALALHHVRGLIAALEAQADGPEPETEAGRTPRSMSVCAAGGSHVHVSGGRYYGEDREERLRERRRSRSRSRSRSQSRSRGRRRRRSRSRSRYVNSDRIRGETDRSYWGFVNDEILDERAYRRVVKWLERVGRVQGHIILCKDTYGDCSEAAALLREGREERFCERRDRRCAPVPEAVESESEEEQQEGRRKRRRAPAREAAESESEEEEEEAPQARRSPRLRGEPALEPEPQLSSSAKRG
jgi:hypothetical protein